MRRADIFHFVLKFRLLADTDLRAISQEKCFQLHVDVLIYNRMSLRLLNEPTIFQIYIYIVLFGVK